MRRARSRSGCCQDHATLVALGGEESLLAGLRRRRVIMDSPRMLARDDRDDAAGQDTPDRKPVSRVQGEDGPTRTRAATARLDGSPGRRAGAPGGHARAPRRRGPVDRRRGLAPSGRGASPTISRGCARRSTSPRPTACAGSTTPPPSRPGRSTRMPRRGWTACASGACSTPRDSCCTTRGRRPRAPAAAPPAPRTARAGGSPPGPPRGRAARCAGRARSQPASSASASGAVRSTCAR